MDNVNYNDNAFDLNFNVDGDILSKFKENQIPYEATNIKASSMRLAEAELFDTAINLFKDMIGEKKNELVNC